MSIVHSLKRIQISGHIQFEHILVFRVFPGYLNLKLILKLSCGQIQKSRIFRLRDILRTLPVDPVKM